MCIGVHSRVLGDFFLSPGCAFLCSRVGLGPCQTFLTTSRRHVTWYWWTSPCPRACNLRISWAPLGESSSMECTEAPTNIEDSVRPAPLAALNFPKLPRKIIRNADPIMSELPKIWLLVQAHVPVPAELPVCEVCLRQFQKSSGLIIHMRRMHPNAYHQK